MRGLPRDCPEKKMLSVEHPTGEFTVIAKIDTAGEVASARVFRTARKLFDEVCSPEMRHVRAPVKTNAGR
jgi:2-methylaconitate cis-trans-isomerase PrpF